MFFFIFLVATLITMFPFPAQPEEMVGRVVDVHDGDSLRLNYEGVSLRIRLYGVDCPELLQLGGAEARALTQQLAYGRVLVVESKGQDRYGRVIGRVFLVSGNTLSRELVKAGRCWWYYKYAPDDQTLAELEAEAKENKRGLWANPSPTPPWEWRIRKKSSGN